MFESFLPDEFLVNIYQGVYILQFPEYNTLLRKKNSLFAPSNPETCSVHAPQCQCHKSTEKKKVALLSCTVYIVFLQFVM